MSSFEWDLLQPARFVGLDNFRELVGDVAFKASLRSRYVAIAVPLRVAIALGLGLLMHRRMRGVGAEACSSPR